MGVHGSCGSPESRVGRTKHRAMLNEKQVEDLLNRLCVRLGVCLPPHEIARLRDDRPGDVVAFTDAVLAAEGWIG
jgi:hypothetical protein